MADTIFIQIPAYRDRELAATLTDLYRTASSANHLRVAVMWQRGLRESLPRSVRQLKNLEIYPVPARESLGPNWARRILQAQYQGEPYTLFLDSHHRFVRHWDVQLLRMFDHLLSTVAKPLITAYLPAYNPATDPQGRTNDVLKIYPLKRTEGLLTHLTGRALPFRSWLKKPIPAGFLSLHFLFTTGLFNREIRFDPKIYFFGDEVLTGFRAFAGGYDLYHPHKVLGWHLYDRATRVTHWADHKGWAEAEAASFRKMRRVFEGRTSLGTIGGHSAPPHRRGIAEYERLIGTRLIES